MRLQRYINEKFFTAIKDREYTEVFVNPTSKDWKDVGSKSVRFIIDFKEQKVYVWDDHTLIHADVMEDTIGLSYREYRSGKNPERYFMGLQNSDKSIESDMYNGLIASAGFVNVVNKLKTYDTKWLNKFGINGDAVKKMIYEPQYRTR